MELEKVIKQRRTIRKFKSGKIEHEVLVDLIDAARLAPSASNVQPLKYMIVEDEQLVEKVYKCVKWAKYIAPEPYHDETGKPSAFIVVLIDSDIRESGYEIDIGAAVENILLSAYDKGIGTCWMGAINRTKIRQSLNIPQKYLLNTVIALGYKDEDPVIEGLDEEGSIRYYKDEDGTLHVPKRSLDDIILKIE